MDGELLKWTNYWNGIIFHFPLANLSISTQTSVEIHAEIVDLTKWKCEVHAT